MSELVWARQTRSGDKHPAFLIDKVSIDEATVWIKWDSNGKEELLPKSFVRSKLPKRNRSSSNTTLRGSTLEKKSSIAKCTKKSNVVASNTAMPQPRPDVPSSSVLPFLAVSAEMAPIFKEDTDDEGDPGEGDMWAPSPVKSSFGAFGEAYDEPERTNNMDKRTRSCINLGPTGNFQGTHKFLNLDTGEVIKRQHFTELPMPDSMIR
jgi:hypothetical protein